MEMYWDENCLFKKVEFVGTGGRKYCLLNRLLRREREKKPGWVIILQQEARKPLKILCGCPFH